MAVGIKLVQLQRVSEEGCKHPGRGPRGGQLRSKCKQDSVVQESELPQKADTMMEGVRMGPC